MTAKTSEDMPMRRARLRAAFPMLVTFGFIWAIYLSLVAIVMVTDPYDIYEWGVEPKLEAGDIPRDLVIKWIDVVTKKPEITTYLVGSSVTAMYSPDDITAVSSENAVSYNLSYGGVRPKDRNIVLQRIARNSRAKHIIITFDWMYILDLETVRDGFPVFLYDDDIPNDLRMADLDTIRHTFDVLGGDHSYDNAADVERYGTFVDRAYSFFQQPLRMAELQALIKRYRPNVDAPSGKTCFNFSALTKQLVPRIRAFAKKGVKVDILIPILSYTDYYYRLSDISPTILDQILITRRCLVKLVNGLPNVRVFAIDDDPSVAGDLGHFRDTGHVYNSKLLKQFITLIANGEHLLTVNNIDTYERSIRTAVKNYFVKNSFIESALSK